MLRRAAPEGGRAGRSGRREGMEGRAVQRLGRVASGGEFCGIDSVVFL